MSTRLFLAALLGAASTLAGCRSTDKYADYQKELDKESYLDTVGIALKDAVLDLTDIVNVEGSAGEGFLVNARFTKFAQAGIGYFDGLKSGWKPRGIGYWREKVSEGGASIFYYRKLKTEPLFGTRGLFDEEAYNYDDWTLFHNPDEHWLDVGAEAHVIFVGAGVNVRPKEAADLFFSLGNIPRAVVLEPVIRGIGLRIPWADLSDDDHRSELGRLYDLGYIHQPKDILPDSNDRR